MPLPALLFLAVLALVAVVVVAPFVLLYLVFGRLCDLVEELAAMLPWPKKKGRNRVRQGLGLSALKTIFSKLPTNGK